MTSFSQIGQTALPAAPPAALPAALPVTCAVTMEFSEFSRYDVGKSHAGKCKVRLVQREQASNTFVQSSAEQIGSQHRCQLTE